VQELLGGNRGLGKPPHGIRIRLLLDHEVEIPLALPVQALHVAAIVARMDARRGRLVLVAAELLEVLRGHASAGRAGMVRAEAGAEGPAVPLALLEIELGLEEGARLEVELVREGVVQRALDARLVGVVGALEGRRRAGEDGGAVEDDGGAEGWAWRLFGGLKGGVEFLDLCCQASTEGDVPACRIWKKEK